MKGIHGCIGGAPDRREEKKKKTPPNTSNGSMNGTKKRPSWGSVPLRGRVLLESRSAGGPYLETLLHAPIRGEKRWTDQKRGG